MKPLLIFLGLMLLSGCVSKSKYLAMEESKNDWKSFYEETRNVWMERALTCEDREKSR